MKISTGIFTFLTVLWMAFLFVLSSQNADFSAKISDRITQVVIDIIEPENKSNTENNTEISAKKDTDIPMPQKEWFGVQPKRFRILIRKIGHFWLFAVLGILSSCIGLCEFEKTEYGYLKKSAGISAVISVSYALIDELHQHFVEGREAAFYDVAIDCAGAFAGILICIALYAFFAKLKSKKTHGS